VDLASVRGGVFFARSVCAACRPDSRSPWQQHSPIAITSASIASRRFLVPFLFDLISIFCVEIRVGVKRCDVVVSQLSEWVPKGDGQAILSAVLSKI
jgi:hypothetical protein